LGKSGTEGRTEPVPIEIKADRQGLGREELLNEIKERKRQAILKARRSREQPMTPQEFRYLTH